MATHAQPEPRNGLGLTSLVLGISALIPGLMPITFWVAGPLAVGAIAFGLAGLARVRRGTATNRWTARFGIATGLLAATLSIVGAVILFGAVDKLDQDLQQIEQDLDTQIACIDQAETPAERDACITPASYPVPPDKATITAWATGHLCVEIRTDAYAEAMRWAVDQVDTTPELTVTVAEWCGGWGIVAVDRSLGEAEARSHAEVERIASEHVAATLVFNSDAPAWPDRDKRMVALHELMHAVMHVDGGEWEALGHTNACASVMSRYTDCILAQGGLTDYDRHWIAKAYDAPWYADAVTAVVERAS